MKKISLTALIEASFFAAFALVLDLLPAINITKFVSISPAMVPIFIIAFRWGFKVSFISGLLWGLLQVVTGDIYFLHIYQFLIEYFIAFAFIGFAGLFSSVIQKQLGSNKKVTAILWIIVAVIFGSFTRYIWHFLAGIIFWGEYAPKGMSPVWYSLIVNGGAMVGSALLCAIVLALLISTAPRLITQKAQGAEHE